MLDRGQQDVQLLPLRADGGRTQVGVAGDRSKERRGEQSRRGSNEGGRHSYIQYYICFFLQNLRRERFFPPLSKNPFTCCILEHTNLLVH